jgi:hypothetical protein
VKWDLLPTRVRATFSATQRDLAMAVLGAAAGACATEASGRTVLVRGTAQVAVLARCTSRDHVPVSGFHLASSTTSAQPDN